MTSRRRLATRACCAVAGAFALVLLTSGRASNRVHAQQQQSTPVSYTSDQAEKGQLAFVEHCASCHGQNLDDGAYGPPLKGADFRHKWGSRAVEAKFTYSSTKMPPTRPGTLGDVSYAQLLAFILQENGSQPGARELPSDSET